MALKSLPSEAMIAATDRLLGPERGMLERLPLAAAFLPRLAAARDGLIATQLPVPSEAAIVEVRGALEASDLDHDDLGRGIYHVLTGWALLTRDPGERAGLEALRTHIYPNGLRIVQMSAADTAGAARLLEGRLDAAQLDTLAQTRVAGATLRTHLRSWLDAGARLGELATQRAELERAVARATPDGNDVVAARNLWIRTVNTLLAVLDLEDDDGALAAHVRAVLADFDRKPTRQAPAPAETEAEPVAG